MRQLLSPSAPLTATTCVLQALMKILLKYVKIATTTARLVQAQTTTNVLLATTLWLLKCQPLLVIAPVLLAIIQMSIKSARVSHSFTHLDCHTNCAECTGSTETECTSCSSSSSVFAYGATSCLTTCPAGTYPNTSTQQCSSIMFSLQTVIHTVLRARALRILSVLPVIPLKY